MSDSCVESDGRSNLERRFIARLRALTGPPHVDVWVDHPQLVTSVDVSDKVHDIVLRTLRVDFDGARAHVWGGNDPTGQLVGELDPTDPDWFDRDDGSTPEACAEIAAAFFKSQGERPIDREEWADGTAVKCRWILVDVGRALVTSAGIPTRPPTQVLRVSSDNP